MATRPDVLDRTAALLAREAGIACPPERRRDLSRAIRESCRAHSIADEDAYLAELAIRPSLLDDLVGALAVGETYFFRDPGQFDLVRHEVIPDLIRSHGRALRVWSAGCASGEEAYSLAIALADAGIGPAPPVLGTDISRAALRRAEEGSYGDWSFRGTPEASREGSFLRQGARWRVSDEVRERTRFEWANLAAEGYPSLRSGIWGFHLIFCRNTLIYLTEEAVAAIARRLHASLAPGGWLFTAPADPPLAAFAPFETVVTSAGVVYRRAAATAVRGAAAPESIPTAPPKAPPPARARAAKPHERRRQAPGKAVAVSRPEDWRERVRALADLGKHDQVARVLAQALRAHPLDPELHYLWAVVCLEQGRDQEGAQAARRCLYLDPDLAVGAVALGSALRRLGDLRGARRAYRSAAAILRRRAPEEPVLLAEGERAGGLLRSVESLLALTDAAA